MTIPEPSPARGQPTVAPGNLIAAKAALYLVIRQDDVRPAELARRMGVDQSAINRLLDPRHASRPWQFDAAFAALGNAMARARRLICSRTPQPATAIARRRAGVTTLTGK